MVNDYIKIDLKSYEFEILDFRLNLSTSSTETFGSSAPAKAAASGPKLSPIFLSDVAWNELGSEFPAFF